MTWARCAPTAQRKAHSWLRAGTTRACACGAPASGGQRARARSHCSRPVRWPGTRPPSPRCGGAGTMCSSPLPRWTALRGYGTRARSPACTSCPRTPATSPASHSPTTSVTWSQVRLHSLSKRRGLLLLPSLVPTYPWSRHLVHLRQVVRSRVAPGSGSLDWPCSSAMYQAFFPYP